MPSDPSGTAFTATTPVNANITVYAKWSNDREGESSPTTSLQAALIYLDSNAEEGGNYTITVNANESIKLTTLSYGNKNTSITLNGRTTERTLSLSSNDSLFTVGSGVTLTLGNNVTLQGRSDNTDPLVRVSSGGTVAMENGSKVSGNTSSSGGGVFVGNGTFTKQYLEKYRWRRRPRGLCVRR
jgi:hypothetical protein